MSEHTTHHVWRFRDGVLVLFTAIAAFALMSWGHMAVVARTIGMETYLGNAERLPASILVISQAMKAAAILGALWLVGLLPKRLGWAAVGLRPVSLHWLALGAVAGAAFVVTGLLLVKGLVALMPQWAGFARAPFAFDATNSGFVIAAFMLMTFAVTPFAEEVFFRGFLYKWMKGHRPAWVAALVSSAIFGVSHIVPPQAINAFAMALVLVWLYEKSGSIWPAIIAHGVNNTAGTVLAALAAHGHLPAFLTPPAVS